MSVLTRRGGIPRIQRVAVDSTGRRYTPGGARTDPATGQYKFFTQYLQIINTTANPVNLFFLEDDFDNGANYVTILGNTAEIIGSWEGPAEVDEFWLKSASGTTVEVVAFQRRG